MTTTAPPPQHNTGPHTPEGKERVSHNARPRGLIGARLNIHPQDQEAFDYLRASQLAEYNPQDSTEQHLFEEIPHSMWTVEKARIRPLQFFTRARFDLGVATLRRRVTLREPRACRDSKPGVS